MSIVRDPKSSFATTLLPSSPADALANIDVNVLDVDILQHAVRELAAITKYNNHQVDAELLNEKRFLAQRRLDVALQKRKNTAAMKDVDDAEQAETRDTAMLDVAIAASLCALSSVDEHAVDGVAEEKHSAPEEEHQLPPLSIAELRAARIRFFMSP